MRNAIILIALCLVGGFLYYYFVYRKNNKSTNGASGVIGTGYEIGDAYSYDINDLSNPDSLAYPPDDYNGSGSLAYPPEDTTGSWWDSVGDEPTGTMKSYQPINFD